MNQLQIKFELTQTKQIASYYAENGYVVIKNVVSHNRIDAFFDTYQKIKNNPFFVYYSQSIHLCIKPEITEYGFIKESMQNASRLAFFSKFSQRFKDCIYSQDVSKALTAVNGHEEHISWQNMFFDRSTGTIEHQDSWYLDTEPSGDLVGVWFALEDIKENCGSFFVCPASHKLGLIDRKDYPIHDDFVKKVMSLLSDDILEKKPMHLNKGDILLWHPYLIHGAFNSSNESLSRKSFTSHYYPFNCKAKDVESGKILSMYNHKHPRATFNPRIYTVYRFSDYIYNLIVYALYLKRKINSTGVKLSMRRESYEELDSQTKT
jgi:phytanoyl-CoA hydroxylase